MKADPLDTDGGSHISFVVGAIHPRHPATCIDINVPSI